MMSPKIQDDLLLYWSGEANSAEAAAVEALLETDFEARRYLEELRGLGHLGDKLAELPAMNSSHDFAAGAVAEILVEKKVSRFPLPWIAAAAVVIALVALGIRSWPRESNEPVIGDVGKDVKFSSGSVNNEPAIRPRLSRRLFSSPRRDSGIKRISIARERARKLRTELTHLPTL